MSAYIVGLTGGIGSGKSAACDVFAKLGIDIIDADIIAREVVQPGTAAHTTIIDKFGTDICHANGQLNRQALRQHIFSNSVDQQWLNQLLHPLIRSQMQMQTQAAQSEYCILAVPLLIENKLQSLVDTVLVIDVDEATQIRRATQRDNNSTEQIKAIMSAQASRSERLAAADHVIDNSNTLDALRKQIEQLHPVFSRTAKCRENLT